MPHRDRRVSTIREPFLFDIAARLDRLSSEVIRHQAPQCQYTDMETGETCDNSAFNYPQKRDYPNKRALRLAEVAYHCTDDDTGQLDRDRYLTHMSEEEKARHQVEILKWRKRRQITGKSLCPIHRVDEPEGYLEAFEDTAGPEYKTTPCPVNLLGRGAGRLFCGEKVRSDVRGAVTLSDEDPTVYCSAVHAWRYLIAANTSRHRESMWARRSLKRSRRSSETITTRASSMKRPANEAPAQVSTPPSSVEGTDMRVTQLSHDFQFHWNVVSEEGKKGPDYTQKILSTHFAIISAESRPVLQWSRDLPMSPSEALDTIKTTYWSLNILSRTDIAALQRVFAESDDEDAFRA